MYAQVRMQLKEQFRFPSNGIAHGHMLHKLSGGSNQLRISIPFKRDSTGALVARYAMAVVNDCLAQAVVKFPFPSNGIAHGHSQGNPTETRP